MAQHPGWLPLKTCWRPALAPALTRLRYGIHVVALFWQTALKSRFSLQFPQIVVPSLLLSSFSVPGDGQIAYSSLFPMPSAPFALHEGFIAPVTARIVHTEFDSLLANSLMTAPHIPGINDEQVLITDPATGETYYVSRKYFRYLMSMIFEYLLESYEYFMSGGGWISTGLNGPGYSVRRCGTDNDNDNKNKEPAPSEDTTEEPGSNHLPDEQPGQQNSGAEAGPGCSFSQPEPWHEGSSEVETPDTILMRERNKRPRETEETALDECLSKRACHNTADSLQALCEMYEIDTEFDTDSYFKNIHQLVLTQAQAITNLMCYLEAMDQKVNQCLQFQYDLTQILQNQPPPPAASADAATQTDLVLTACTETSTTEASYLATEDTASEAGDLREVSSTVECFVAQDSSDNTAPPLRTCINLDLPRQPDSQPDRLADFVRQFPRRNNNEEDYTYQRRVMTFINQVMRQHHSNLCIEAKEGNEGISVYATKQFNTNDVILDYYGGAEFQKVSEVDKDLQPYLQGFFMKRKKIFVLSNTPLIFYQQSSVGCNAKIDPNTRKVVACSFIPKGTRILFRRNR